MRSTAMIPATLYLALAYVPAFGQDTLNDRLNDILNPSKVQARASGSPERPNRPTPRLFTVKMLPQPAAAVCSIPLLNAASPGTPVHMPGALRLRMHQPGQPSPLDGMKVVAPEPACKASAGSTGVPAAAPAATP